MRTLLALALIFGTGLGLLQARRQLVRSWFVPGPLLVQSEHRPIASTARRELAPLRVLLVDGLRADVSRSLPAFSSLCAAGITLRLDVGFPTVSLPVQHALWTGAWQQQSGILFTRAGLQRPRLPSLPGLVGLQGGRSLAVAEAHREIAGSFPFTAIVAPARGEPPLAPDTLTAEALAAAASDAALVLIHTLAVDAAGHYGGPLTPSYRAAARRSDALLAQLWQARQPRWTLAALSDHGHRLLGGHGDVEPAVRWVTACMAGPGLPAGARAEATIVDLHHIFAERLGLPWPLRSSGRPLDQVLAGVAINDPHQPSCSLLAQTLSLLVAGGLLLGLVAGLRRIAAGRDHRSLRACSLALPWGLTLALLVLCALGGAPSLSAAYVYPRVSPLLLAAGLAGALLAVLQLWGMVSAGVNERLALGVLCLGLLAPTLGALLLTGWPWLLPALCPYASGWASALSGLSGVMLCGVALGGLVQRWSRKRGAPISAACLPGGR